MPGSRTSSALLCLLSASLLGAQDRPMPLRSLESGDASRSFFREAALPGFPAPKERPVVSKTVAVEDLGIQIPPPPANVAVAYAGNRKVQEDAARSLAYLRKELDQLEKDQKAALDEMKQHPELLQIGADTDLFRSLQSLSRDASFQDARKAFLETGRKAHEAMEAKRDHAGALVDLKRASDQADVEHALSDARTGTGAAPLANTANWFDMKQDLDDLSLNQMLATYAGAWTQYSAAIDQFVQRVAKALEVREEVLPPSTLILVRLLKIQVFQIYRLQIREQALMWDRYALRGDRPIGHGHMAQSASQR